MSEKLTKNHISLQLAQNEAMGGAGDHRPSISGRRKPSGVIQRRAQQQNLLISFICLMTCVFLLIVFFGEYFIWMTNCLGALSYRVPRLDDVSGFYADVHPIIDSVATSLGYQNKQYAVVIDAGSTGSRVLAYEFHKAVYSE